MKLLPSYQPQSTPGAGCTRIAIAAFEASFDAVDSSLDNVEQAAAAFEVAPPPPRVEARQLIGRSEDAKKQLITLQGQVSSVAPGDVLPATARSQALAIAVGDPPSATHARRVAALDWLVHHESEWARARPRL